MDGINRLEERRIFDRFPARYPAKFKDTRDSFGEKVYVHDACADGIKMSTKEKLFVNDSITLEVKLPDNENPMDLKGRVVWIKSIDTDMWDIGMKFHKVDLFHMSRLYEQIEPLAE